MNNLRGKEILRDSLPISNLTPASFGKLSEQVRKTPFYRQAQRIFIAPNPALLQVRINALIDQKEVIMPSPGLKSGFFRFKANTIPFKKLPHALTFKGMTEFSEKISSDLLGSLNLDLLVIFSQAVDQYGGRLGSGLGFTDITLALANEYGSFNKKCKVLSVVAENGVLPEEVPRDPWDISLDGYVTHCQAISFANSGNVPKIIWSELPKKRIRKIQPLWDLYCDKNPLTPEVEKSRI